MHIVWHIRYPEEIAAPLPSDEAVAVAVHTLGDQVGLAVPDDAVVYVSDEPLLGTYGIARLHRAHQREGVWACDLASLQRVMTTMADAEFAKSAHPERGTFEHEAYRIIRRRFLHWPEEQVREVADLLPRLRELALAMAPEEGFGLE